MSIADARKLRKQATEAEKVLWRALRATFSGTTRFRRQHPIAGYVVDFACLEKHLIVEVDGGQHAEEDPRRTAELEALGYLVVRFWNNDVLTNTDGVIAEIAALTKQR